MPRVRVLTSQLFSLVFAIFEHKLMQNRSISILFMMFPCFTAKKAMKHIKKGQKKFEKKKSSDAGNRTRGLTVKE